MTYLDPADLDTWMVIILMLAMKHIASLMGCFIFAYNRSVFVQTVESTVSLKTSNSIQHIEASEVIWRECHIKSSKTTLSKAAENSYNTRQHISDICAQSYGVYCFSCIVQYIDIFQFRPQFQLSESLRWGFFNLTALMPCASSTLGYFVT